MQKKTKKQRKSKEHVLYQKKRNERRTQQILLALIIVTIAVLTGVLILHVKKSLAQMAAPETPQNIQTHIPKEVKQALPKIASPAASFQIPILMYHYIEFVQDKRDTIRQSLDIIPPVFDEQLQTLQNAGYTFITPKDLADYMDGLATPPEHPIILSFDDGYRDFYTDAFPVLKKYNAHAVAYVVPGFLDTPNYLFTWQLHEIARSGLVEIGAHTMHHVSLKGMEYDRAKTEIVDSKTTLENELHMQVVSFAYPYGSFDLQAMQIVKDAGFRTAVSTIPGVEEDGGNRYFIYRVRPGGRVADQLLNFLKQTSYSPW